MNRKALLVALTGLLAASINAATACEYKAGETKFVEYANCRYGEDSIQVIKLSEGSNWEECIYYMQAFSPAKLLAVTKQKNGKEVISINNRKQIGNPCYLTKSQCDAALKAYN